MNQLDKIIAHKRHEIEVLIPKLDKFRAQALIRNDFKSFQSCLDQGTNRLGVIAEIKQASPSVGLIDPNFDFKKQAKLYEKSNAHCLSVLTDRQFFKGDLSHLNLISQSSKLPLLRKDFIIHEIQIYEACIAGADCILLIVAALTREELIHLHQVARNVQLEVLVEIHNLQELKLALELSDIMIGVNNRDLTTFQTNLAITEKIIPEIPDGILAISESGIRQVDDAQRVLNAGANAILVGESLMKAHKPRDLLNEFCKLTAQN